MRVEPQHEDTHLMGADGEDLGGTLESMKVEDVDLGLRCKMLERAYNESNIVTHAACRGASERSPGRYGRCTCVRLRCRRWGMSEVVQIILYVFTHFAAARRGSTYACSISRIIPESHEERTPATQG